MRKVLEERGLGRPGKKLKPDKPYFSTKPVVSGSAVLGCDLGELVRILIARDPTARGDPADGGLAVPAQYPRADLHNRHSEAGPMVSAPTLLIAAVESEKTAYRWPLACR